MPVTGTNSYTADACRYCSSVMAHSVERCPVVKSVEYRKDGSIKRVELMRAGDYLPAPYPYPYQWTWTAGGTVSQADPSCYTIN